MKSYSISEAQASFETVIDEALAGETVILTRNSHLLEIRKFDGPIPMPPDGWLDEMFSDPAEIEWENSLLADQFNSQTR